jgi:hypothetical protein
MRYLDRTGGGPTGRVVAAFVLVMCLVACDDDGGDDSQNAEALGTRGVSIIEGSVVDDRTVNLLVDSCQATLTSEVTEAADEVSMRIVAEGGSAVADCIDDIDVGLESELGDRAIVDDTTGSVVPVD